MTRSTSRYRDVVAHLLDCGLVSPADVHRHGVLASDTSRSHGVTIVEVGDEQGFVVKDFGDSATDDLQGSIARERAVYRLAERHAELQPFTARSHPGGDDDFLVIDYLRDVTSIGQLIQRSSLYDPAVAEMAGSQLAAWHQHTGSLGEESIVPASTWVFRLFGDDRPEFLSHNRPVAEWSASFLRRTMAAKLLAEAESWWQPGAIVHGDLRFENCLVSGSGSSVGLRFVDWEQAGWGDPAWDVASFLQEYFTFGGVLTLAAEPDRRLQQAIGTFLNAYRGVARVGPDFLRRVVAFTGAKMLHRAVQIVSWQQRSDGPDPDRHGLLGVELLERVDDGVAWLEGSPITGSASTDVLSGAVRDDLDQAVSMAQISSGRSATVAGVEVVSADSGVAGGPAAMANAIGDALYGPWYLGAAAGRSRPDEPAGPVTPEQLDLAGALSAVHTDANRFDPGWIVDLASTSGRLRVSKDDRRVEIDAVDAVGEAARAPRPGDTVAVRQRITWVDPDTRTWWTRSPHWMVDPGQAVTRFYWNLRVDSVVSGVAALTAALAPLDARWTMKVQIDSEQQWRPDAAVVYVAAADASNVVDILPVLAADMRPFLDRATPRLAERIEPGIAMADGIVNGRSFGQVRCSLVADGLVIAAMTGDDPVAAIVERFRRAGLDPSRPHLDPANLELVRATR